MNKNLVSALPFSADEVDVSHPTLSLLKLCAEHGIISTEKLARIKADIDEAARETMRQFTRRESSTVPMKKAEEIYASVVFQADVFLLSTGNYARAVDFINKNDMRNIIELGREAVLKYHEQTIVIVDKLRNTRPKFSTETLDDAVGKEFDAYKKRYSARFNSTDICCSVDYPLLCKNAYELKSFGVLYMREYYTSLLYENIFINRFEAGESLALLNSFARRYGCRFSELIFNICRVFINNALAHAMVLGGNEPSIRISEADVELLCEKFSLRPRAFIEEAAMRAFDECFCVLENPQVLGYLRAYVPVFAEDLFNHFTNGGTENFIIAFD